MIGYGFGVRIANICRKADNNEILEERSDKDIRNTRDIKVQNNNKSYSVSY